MKGNHVFSCETWDEMASWMEGIRAAVEDDKSMSTRKSGMSTTPGTMNLSQLRDALGQPGFVDPPIKPKPLDMRTDTDLGSSPLKVATAVPQLAVESSKNQFQFDHKQDPLSTSSNTASGGRHLLEKVNTFCGSISMFSFFPCSSVLSYHQAKQGLKEAEPRWHIHP